MRALGLAGLVVAIGCCDRKSNPLEAEQKLAGLYNNAKRMYSETGVFPVGVVPLTPETPCCKGPAQRCVSSPETWQHPVWKALAFHVDEPGRFQYSYESDGKTLTAKAVGDLDCNGIASLTVLFTRLNQDGNPEMTLLSPGFNPQ
jgi:hypothetical protein